MTRQFGSQEFLAVLQTLILNYERILISGGGGGIWNILETTTTNMEYQFNGSKRHVKNSFTVRWQLQGIFQNFTVFRDIRI